jgi:hypothetical protein
VLIEAAETAVQEGPRALLIVWCQGHTQNLLPWCHSLPPCVVP